ncbi:MAG: Holliday junction resolvase RuvX [bacterium]|nr:Holliday junction resolvase RuvX [bacterium]MDA1292573.1 Holliday junction resolvase RuvX [bacterium]
MNYLGLDIGTRRTGVAFANSEDGILFSLQTIAHTSVEELRMSVLLLIEEKQIDEVVIGLPLLLSGEAGSQAEIVQNFKELLLEEGISCSLLDERYTTSKSREIDKDAASACEILTVWLSRNRYNDC